MKALITDRFSQNAMSLMKSNFEVSTDISQISETEILVIRSRTIIDKELLDKALNLKMIVTSTSGYDHIDFSETEKRKITVTHTPDANAQSTAELTWTLILNMVKDFQKSQKMISTQNWDRKSLNSTELKNKTLGIVGFGRVGSRVAQIGKAFGMTVYAYDPYKNDEDFNGVLRVGYTELLRLSAIICYHVPNTQETKKMLNRNLFPEMLDGCMIVNTCRGDVINEQDLLYGLEIGRISRAALDVYQKEPLDPKSPLANHPQILCSPHIGATTFEAFEESSMQAALKCIDFKNGKQLKDLLPYDKPWWNYTFRRN